MLPKVSAAISRLIEPISSSGLARLPRERQPGQDAQSGKKDKKEEPATAKKQDLAKVIPIRSTQGSPDLIKPVALALHALRRGASASVTRLMGWSAYARTLLQSRKSKNGSSKGLIIDRRIE